MWWRALGLAHFGGAIFGGKPTHICYRFAGADRALSLTHTLPDLLRSLWSCADVDELSVYMDLGSAYLMILGSSGAENLFFLVGWID